MNVLFVYDDGGGVPDRIRRIIGASRFGDIVRHKRRLADSIQIAVETVPGCEFLQLKDESLLGDLLNQIERLPSESMVFRLPSSIVPVSTDLFRALITKLPYAIDPVIYGDQLMSDVPALMLRNDAIAILGERDPAKRRKLVGTFERRALHVDDALRFVDISEISNFLTFMAGTTETRNFNVSSVSAGVFRKWSHDVSKMRAEYSYFHIADEAMKRFLLPTFDFKEGAQGASYAMEYLSVPDAALQILHHTFNEASFDRLMTNFFAFIDARGRRNVGVEEVRRVAEQEIVIKLRRRVSQLLETPVGQQLEVLLRNAGPHGDLQVLVERCCVQLAKALDGSRIDFLALGHGDPCFSNILFNPEINLFRLIDPRGAETREAAFMHPVYDLAKFSHSVIGGYDFVNSGLAECKLDAKMRLALTLERGGPRSWLKSAFKSRLAELGWDATLVRAIEASLFLSMLPLHIDSPDKLPAFCLIAGGIIEELEHARD
jgi:hypothetical protein